MTTRVKIRIILSAFISLLLLSGITAFPLKSEIDFLVDHLSVFPTSLQVWILSLQTDIYSTPDSVLYGTDWLAFAHIVIALFFVPVLIDPPRYQLNLKMGMLACFFVFPVAFICGPIRNIPFFHQLIDCSFGVFGLAFLFYADKQIKILKKQNHETLTF